MRIFQDFLNFFEGGARKSKRQVQAFLPARKRTGLEACRHLGAAHRGLWQTLRGSRAAEQSSQRANGPNRNDPNVKAEIQHIEAAIINVDMRIIRKYGSVEEISDRLIELKDLPKRSGSVGATIDGFETWVSSRVKVVETV